MGGAGRVWVPKRCVPSVAQEKDHFHKYHTPLQNFSLRGSLMLSKGASGNFRVHALVCCPSGDNVSVGASGMFSVSASGTIDPLVTHAAASWHASHASARMLEIQSFL